MIGGGKSVWAFMHGFLLAFGLILPLGVQNVFIFNQGAVQPRFYKALPAVIAATLCDATLIILAVMGVSVLILTVGYFKYILLLIGIIFLIYMGIVTWRSQDDGNGTNPDRMTAKKQVLFACSVSLLNPHAILDTIGRSEPVRFNITVPINSGLLLPVSWYPCYGLLLWQLPEACLKN